ncbi:MAG: dihydrofolate reductase [Solirubrobacteraceae bacterium]|nr:dihydrofolate reductase [Solirubrobacteraceae bacterium]
MAGHISVFIACSLDGFIAGPDDDLSWLPEPDPAAGDDFGYAAFMAGTAAIVMGRNTYDVVAGFDGDWPYGDTPVFVVTSRPLDPKAPTVKAISGDPVDVVAAVQQEVGDGGIYVDGGSLIRSLLDAGLVDDLTVTVVPVILGAGAPLFAGVVRRHALELVSSDAHDNGLVQLRYTVVA